MPENNNEYFIWFSNEQVEPLKVNISPNKPNLENFMPRSNSEILILDKDQTDENDFNINSNSNDGILSGNNYGS